MFLVMTKWNAPRLYQVLFEGEGAITLLNGRDGADGVYICDNAETDGDIVEVSLNGSKARKITGASYAIIFRKSPIESRELYVNKDILGNIGIVRIIVDSQRWY